MVGVPIRSLSSSPALIGEPLPLDQSDSSERSRWMDKETRYRWSERQKWNCVGGAALAPPPSVEKLKHALLAQRGSGTFAEDVDCGWEEPRGLPGGLSFLLPIKIVGLLLKVIHYPASAPGMGRNQGINQTPDSRGGGEENPTRSDTHSSGARGRHGREAMVQSNYSIEKSVRRYWTRNRLNPRLDGNECE